MQISPKLGFKCVLPSALLLLLFKQGEMLQTNRASRTSCTHEATNSRAITAMHTSG